MGINLEGTPEFQRGFDAVCPDIEGRDVSPHTRIQEHDTRVHEARVGTQAEVQARMHNVITHIMQSIVAESPYKPDMEWSLWHQAHQLEEENGLPDGVTAEDIFQAYLRVFHHE